jgi:hypothetical protein
MVKKLLIEEFKGKNINIAPKLPSKIPRKVFNLQPTREGGLKPHASPILRTLPIIGQLLGYDYFGRATLKNGLNYSLLVNYNLIRTVSFDTNAVYPVVGTPAYIDGVGSYRSYNHFAIFDRETRFRTPRTISSLGTLSIVAAFASPSSVVAKPEFASDNNTRSKIKNAITKLHTQRGWVIAGQDDEEGTNVKIELHRTTDNGDSDTEVVLLQDELRVANKGLTWNRSKTTPRYYLALAGTSRGYLSTDGINWTDVSATLGAGNNFYCCRYFGTTVIFGSHDKSNSGITMRVSTNDGAAFTDVAVTTTSVNEEVLDLAFSSTLNVYVAVTRKGVLYTAPASDPKLAASWTFTTLALAAEEFYGIEWVENQFFIPTGKGHYVSPNGSAWSFAVDRDTEVTGQMTAIRYDPVRKIAVEVGEGGSIFVYDAIAAMWKRVNFNQTVNFVDLDYSSDGVSTTADGNRWMLIPYGYQGYKWNTGTTQNTSVYSMSASIPAGRLRKGEYTFYIVAYHLSALGKMVFDVQENKFTISNDGSKVDIKYTGTLPVDTYMTAYVKYSDLTILDEKLRDESIIEIFTLTNEEKEFAVEALPIGQEIGSNGQFFIPVFEGRVEKFNGRSVGVLSDDINNYLIRGIKNFDPFRYKTQVAIAFTDIGYDNLCSPDNIIYLTPKYDNVVTAISSTSDNAFGNFGGVIIFFKQEAFVISGNLDDLLSVRLTAYPEPIGCDVGVIPARLSSIIFVIWNGELYALGDGKTTKVATEVWVDKDPFVQVIAESSSKSLMVVTKSGQVYRLFLDYKFWIDNAFDFTGDAVANVIDKNSFVLPENTSLGSIFVNKLDEAYSVNGTDFNEPSTFPYMEYQEVSDGNFNRAKWLRARTIVENHTGSFDMVVTDELNVAATIPSRATNQDTQMFGFPNRLNSRYINMRINLINAGVNTIISPPIEIEYVDREENKY